MHLLIIASTFFEFYEFKSQYEYRVEECLEKKLQLSFLVTGVGVVPTTYHLLRHLNTTSDKYDGIIQIGIAGSFGRKCKIGDIVHVNSEVFGDAGAEENDGTMLDLFELNLWEKNEKPFDNKILFESENFPIKLPNTLIPVHGLTVGLGAGKSETIHLRKKKFAADTESMEGAAFFYVSIMEQIPFRQIRSISNMITPRAPEQWQIKESIDSLNDFMINWLL